MTETLFDPMTMPCKGMNSALIPSALEPGEWALLQNVRLGDRSIKMRGGTPAALGTIDATGSFRGSWTGIFNTAYTLFVAMANGGTVKIYKSTAAASWTEITAGSGIYGVTTLTDTGNRVTFEKVWDPLQTVTGSHDGDCLVIQNGTDNPRIYGFSTQNNAYAVAVSGTIGANTDFRNAPVIMQTIEDTFFVNNLTYVNSSANMALSFSGVGRPGVTLLTINNTVVANDNCVATHTTAQQILSGRQLLIGIDTAYTQLLQNIQIKVGTKVIWDPTVSTFPSYSVVPISATSSKSIYVFDIVSLGISTSYSTDNFTIKWVGTAPSATQTASIFLFVGQPDKANLNQGGCQFGASLYNQGARCEAPGVIYTNYQTQQISTYGSTSVTEQFPNSPLIYYQYSLPYGLPNSPASSDGADYLNVYRKQPGEVQFSYVGSNLVWSWAPSTWTANGSSPYFAVATGSDPTVQVYMPDGLHVTLPKAIAMKSANGRLFVGAASSGEANLLFSEYKHPFRFRRYTRYLNGSVDETSPSAQNIRGETVNAIEPVASSTIGVSTVYIFTDQNLYACRGVATSQLSYQTRIGPHGTISPQSISVLKTALFWLDQTGQVKRAENGQVMDLGRRIVDDQTKGVPGSRKSKVYGCCFNDRYYLSYTPSGGSTNTRILVWEDYVGVWVRDLPPTAAEGLIKWFDGTNKRDRLLLFSTDGKVYEYDVDGTTGNTLVTQDLGANIPISLTTRDIHMEGWNDCFLVNRIGILTDVLASGLITYTRTYKPKGTVGTSTVNIDQTGNQAYLYDAHISQPSNETSGPSCQINVSGNLAGGAVILGLVAEIEKRSKGYAVSTV